MSSDKLFKALSDPTRLRLLRLLERFELNVNEIMRVMDMGQSRISRHLKILTDSGLVTVRREGQWAYYRSDDGEVAGKAMNLVRDLVEEELEPWLARTRDPWLGA